MKNSKNLFIVLMSFFSFMLFPIEGFLQTLSEDYDRREAIIDPFEQEDKELHDKKISEIISRINRSDKAVLRLIVFETLEKVHEKIVQDEKQTGKTYFDILGGQNAIPAIVGGFDNQDPRVRLKMIGYLGFWVEELGTNLGYIESSVDQRMNSNIETRKEVRYAFRILKMKITRKKVVGAIKTGDQKALVRISPEEFLPLVYYEPRIRTIYLGSSSAVKIRSIVLDEGVEPETGNLVGNAKGRHPGLNIESICYQGVQTYNFQSEVAQWNDSNAANTNNNLNTSGGDSGSEKNYAQTSAVGSQSNLDWNCVRAIYTGIDNKSQFVREHSARIFLNYIRGYTGDLNYVGSLKTKIRMVAQDLVKMSQTPYFVRIAQVAWDNVKWSEFNYNDRVVSGLSVPEFVKNRFYMEYDYSKDKAPSNAYVPPASERYFTNDVITYPEWGTEMTGNYRNDIKEILRILGQSYYLDPEYVPKEAIAQYYQSKVTGLFGSSNKNDVLEGQSQSPTGYTNMESATTSTVVEKSSTNNSEETEIEDQIDDSIDYNDSNLSDIDNDSQ